MTDLLFVDALAAYRLTRLLQRDEFPPARALREAVGEDVELMVDFHGRCASAAAALPHELVAGHVAYYTISVVFAAASLTDALRALGQQP